MSSVHRVASTRARAGSSGPSRVEGQLENGNLVGVDRAAVAEQATVVRERGRGEASGVAEVGRSARGVEQGLAEQRDRQSGVARYRDRSPGRARASDQDRRPAETGRVPVRSTGGRRQERAPASGVAGLAGVGDRLREIDRLGRAEPVPGELTRPAPGRSPHSSSSASATLPVRTRAAVVAEVLVQGVLDQRVSEVVAPGRVGHLAHERYRRGRVEHVEQVVFGCRVARAKRSRSKSRPITAAIDNTRSGVCSQPHDPAANHLAHGVGQRPPRAGSGLPATRRRSRRTRAGLHEVPQHLTHEERVAVGLPIHRVRELDAVPRARDRRRPP